MALSSARYWSPACPAPASPAAELAPGLRVVDTDDGDWTDPLHRLWREGAMAALLTGHRSGALFVAGCVENQGRFAACSEHVVLLSAPIDVLLARVAARTINP